MKIGHVFAGEPDFGELSRVGRPRPDPGRGRPGSSTKLNCAHVLFLFIAILIAAVAHADNNWRPTTNPLMTPWADKVDAAHPLAEYPRPQMVRKQWTNLNGLWDYAITDQDAKPDSFAGSILVPFPIESALSGVRKELTPKERLWYRRSFDRPALAADQRLLLHFGAVDWETTVYVNGKEIGTHQGGYDSFTFDITDELHDQGNELMVSVWDSTGDNGSAKGKQYRPAFAKPRGILYTPASGIWQTVWLEPVAAQSIEYFQATPDIDHGVLKLKVTGRGIDKGDITAVISDGAQPIATVHGALGSEIEIPIPNAKLWTPESPFLYLLRIHLQKDGKLTDTVESYFAMRKISLGKDDAGITRMMLNNKPVFLAGPLDQGYWPDGIYTAPTDEALRYDIEITKKLGFNCTRKHVKIEPERWYYWCDKLGLMVWQDMPSGNVGKGGNRNKKGDGTAGSAEAAKQFESELQAMVQQHANHPCIVMWTVFNEGWGQYDTARLAQWVKELDPTRLVDDASGWVDADAGDVHDMHHYPDPGCYPLEPKRAAVLGEFGGLGLPIEGHKWDPSAWGYRTMTSPRALNQKYLELWKQAWGLKVNPGLCAAIYTQLTDVETESNGLLSYDRKVIKVDVAASAAAVARGEFPPLPTYETVVPTAEAQEIQWRFTTDHPADDWFVLAFDATGWKQGPGGFGKGASDAGKVRTPWSTDDIWLRREIDLPQGKVKNLLLRCYHDDDAEVYLNGVRAATLHGYVDEYDLSDLSPAAMATLKPGKNLIAIHCHQIKGGQYIDAGLVQEKLAAHP